MIPANGDAEIRRKIDEQVAKEGERYTLITTSNYILVTIIFAMAFVVLIIVNWLGVFDSWLFSGVTIISGFATIVQALRMLFLVQAVEDKKRDVRIQLLYDATQRGYLLDMRTFNEIQILLDVRREREERKTFYRRDLIYTLVFAVVSIVSSLAITLLTKSNH